MFEITKDLLDNMAATLEVTEELKTMKTRIIEMSLDIGHFSDSARLLEILGSHIDTTIEKLTTME